jgi:hypothetical protein
MITWLNLISYWSIDMPTNATGFQSYKLWTSYGAVEVFYSPGNTTLLREGYAEIGSGPGVPVVTLALTNPITYQIIVDCVEFYSAVRGVKYTQARLTLADFNRFELSFVGPGAGAHLPNIVGLDTGTVLGVEEPGHPACECGAHKVGCKQFGPGHSDWCPVRGTR